MNRRQFVYTSAAGLGWLARAQAEQAADQKKLRVGMIGCGWYGKTDLFRLIQVSPVEVVSLCDVDSRMLADAAELTSQR
jgi:predicted homoserine dehydrogenase-like protein